jgi:hypothetical protein
MKLLIMQLPPISRHFQILLKLVKKVPILAETVQNVEQVA